MYEGSNLSEGGLDSVGRHILSEIKGALTHIPDQKAQGKILQAVYLGIQLHQNQESRVDGPYPNHLLRVTRRILSGFEIQDPDVLAAAALHDSVEDQADTIVTLYPVAQDPRNMLTARENAFDYIRQHFGEGTEQIVRTVTEEGSGVPTQDEKHAPRMSAEDYIAVNIKHLPEAIRDVRVFYVKLSDFMDNALQLGHIQDQKDKYWYARKYERAYPIYRERLREPDVEIPADKKASIIDRLDMAEMYAKDVIAQYADWAGYGY